MVSGVNSAKVEMKNATVGFRRIYVVLWLDRVYVRLRIGLLSAPLPAIARPRGGLCSFCCCICQPWVHAWVCLGHLPLCAPWTLVFCRFWCAVAWAGLASFFLKGATTPSGKSLARFGFALKSRFSECLGRSSDLRRSGVVLWRIPSGGNLISVAGHPHLNVRVGVQVCGCDPRVGCLAPRSVV